MLQFTDCQLHWNYFLSVQEDFERTTRYVEPHEDNKNTFSTEYARILMTASQEIDVVMKLLCGKLDGSAAAENVTKYEAVIGSRLPKLKDAEVSLIRFGMSSKPFSGWTSSSSPDWWKANNAIKHSRSSEFPKANLQNAFNAVAALLISVVHFYKADLETAGTAVDWSQVSEHLRIAFTPMSFELKNPVLPRVIDGGKF